MRRGCDCVFVQRRTQLDAARDWDHFAAMKSFMAAAKTKVAAATTKLVRDTPP